MNAILKFMVGITAMCYTVAAMGQEGTTYPYRKSFFPLAQNSQTSTNNGTRDILNSGNNILLSPEVQGTDYAYITDRNGNAKAAMQVIGFSSGKAMSQGNIINLNQNGFTLAFWVKFPAATNPDKTTTLVRFSNLKVGGAEDLWKCGLVSDGRVFVSRYTNKASGANKMWDVKFWEPTAANINKYIKDHGTAAWFFIMVVQEKGQMRLQVGMPDGRFDCMYLDYGLDDQTKFNNHISDLTRLIIVFPGNEKPSYIDDLAIWEKPLCRAEAFAYFKDVFTPAPPDSLYPFNTSEVNSDVQDDDVARMNAVARSPAGCMAAPPGMVVASQLPASPIMAAAIPPTGQEQPPAKVVVYPNPASDRITVDFSEAWTGGGNTYTQLYDMNGKLLAQKRFNLAKGDHRIVWDNIRQYRIPTGIYVLKCVTAGAQYSAIIAIDCNCGSGSY